MLQSNIMESIEDNTIDSKTKKKNHRGTRRQQRYRAKQKLWQLCEIASAQAAHAMEIEENLENRLNMTLSLDNQDHVEMREEVNKQERELVVVTPITEIPHQIIESFSQLSIIPHVTSAVKQQRRTSKYDRSSKQRSRPKRKKKLSSSSSSSSLPDYLNVPHRIFKKMFISASENLYAPLSYDMINQWLDNNSNMRHIRKYAHLLDKSLYLQLQQSLWTEYFNIGSLPDGIWASEIQDKINHQMTNKSVTIDPLSFVTQYRAHIEEQLHATENELNKHRNLVKYVIGQKSQVQPIDLSGMLKAFIRRGQHKLNAEFECKKRLLHFDYQGHLLTKAFFDLKPTKKQIRSAKKIWSLTLKQQIAEEKITIIKHRIFAKIIPKTLDSIDRSLDDINRSLREKIIDNDIRAALVSRRDKIIGQLKLDIMTIDISTTEAIARGHARLVKEEKEMLLLLISIRHSDDADETTRHNIINAIQAREENIIKRAQYVTGCKVSFFDETPAVLMN
ncbi:unnamed protein product [Adineta steineri]|uniref:Uncharacterized protein n=2 Tax=Adineta steineri TaxID=433720 RepID=A0A815TF13_9BILA|nr:unnamed protein product [Adineta steineri]